MRILIVTLRSTLCLAFLIVTQHVNRLVGYKKEDIILLKAVKKLISAAFAGTNTMTVGNHSFTKEGSLLVFKYHWSEVCIADPERHYVVYDNCGFNTSSTTRAINSYREAFSDYEEVTKDILNRL